MYISGSLTPGLLVDEGPTNPVQVVIPRPPLIVSNLEGGGGTSTSGRQFNRLKKIHNNVVKRNIDTLEPASKIH